MDFKDNTQRLYDAVKKDYFKLADVKEFGVKKFTDSWIFGKLANKFYKSPKTIENIVFSRVKRYN